MLWAWWHSSQPTSAWEAWPHVRQGTCYHQYCCQHLTLGLSWCGNFWCSTGHAQVAGQEHRKMHQLMVRPSQHKCAPSAYTDRSPLSTIPVSTRCHSPRAMPGLYTVDGQRSLLKLKYAFSLKSYRKVSSLLSHDWKWAWTQEALPKPMHLPVSTRAPKKSPHNVWSFVYRHNSLCLDMKIAERPWSCWLRLPSNLISKNKPKFTKSKFSEHNKLFLQK